MKSRFGKNNVQIEYEGNIDFLQQSELVKTYNNYGNYVEAQLVRGADPQQLLRLVMERARVNRFELMEPSLEEIFKEVVGKTDA